MPSAERVQWAKTRSAILAASALSVLAVLIYLLSGGTWLKAKTLLNTYLPDSTGVTLDTPVLLNGVHIGKVDSLRLTKSKDPARAIEVRLKVQEEFLPHIPEDSLTGVDSETMLGDKYIDITMGRNPRAVRPGGELRFRPPSTLVKSIDLEQFERQLRAIDQTIGDIQQGKGSLGEIRRPSDQLYRSVLKGVVDPWTRARRRPPPIHTRSWASICMAPRRTESTARAGAPTRTTSSRSSGIQPLSCGTPRNTTRFAIKSHNYAVRSRT